MPIRSPLAGLLFLLSIPAFAAETGDCATPETMTARLKAEDQHTIATADLITQDKHLFGMMFTMSGDRRTGYIVKADQPLGDRAAQLCIYNRLANIRLFDARKPGVDPATLLKAPEADALRRCDELVKAGKVWKGGCISLNTGLRRVEPEGKRVVFQALNTAKAADGTDKPDGTLTTVSGRIGGTTADFANDPAAGIVGSILYTSLPDGATVINATLVYVEYTPYGLAALK